MLTIGKAARKSGLTSHTIRYYERLRLIARPRRSEGGYRLYDEPAVDRLRLIRRARSMGLSLDEIAAIFVRCSGGDECTRVRELLTQKIEELDEQVAAMTSFRDSLSEYRGRCDHALKSGARRCLLFSDNEN